MNECAYQYIVENLWFTCLPFLNRNAEIELI